MVFLLFVAPLRLRARPGSARCATSAPTSGRLACWRSACSIVTMVGVAVVAHASIAGLSWPSAFVLGTLVAPTDTVAVAAIAEQVRLPRR